jgi:2-polyprenyl-6-methoxyphenol hydroxylase-like FAD-dependent oxidoreductase
MASKDSQVLIVGGGFAGPVLALALHARGITSAVYETRQEGNKQGGNIALAPNALRVLDAVGVYDDIRVSGYNYQELYLSNSHGAELGKFLNGSHIKYHYPAIRIHRRDVRDFLLARLKAEGIPIHYGKKLKFIVSETEESVTLAFEDGSQATGDYAVGCDGIHSKLRHCAFGSKADPVFQGAMGLMGTVYPDQLTDILGPVGEQDTNKWPVALPRMTFGEAGMFGCFPADFAGTEFGFMTTQLTKARTREGWAEFEKDKQAQKEEMERAFLKEKGGADYPKETRLLVDRARPETLSSWPFFVVPHLDRWFSETGRVLFIGDAAHAIPPTGGLSKIRMSACEM